MLAYDLVYRSDDKFESYANTVYPARPVSVKDTHAAANCEAIMFRFLTNAEEKSCCECMLCGLHVLRGYFLNPSLISRELLKHTNGLVDTKGGYLRISAKDGENVRAYGLIVEVYPQLVMLDIVDNMCFMDKLSKIMEEYKMSGVHSIDVAFAEGSGNPCYDHKIKEMFAKADYSCAIVDDTTVTHTEAPLMDYSRISRGRDVCGLVYDSGMPHIDIVLCHMKTHSKIIKSAGK